MNPEVQSPAPVPSSLRPCAAALALAALAAGPLQAAPQELAPERQVLPVEELELDEVVVDADDFVLERSARVRFAADVIADAAGDGVLRVRGDDLVVDLTGSHLHGAAEGTQPDSYTGVGLVLEGEGIRVIGARVSGFKVAIDAREVDGLVLEDADVSDNFRQRLGSTPEREDSSDWLWPHDNDGGEWLANYGAGIHVKDAANVTIRRCRARDVQNGLIVDRLVGSRIYDNDFSFLSGWGIAMWRSSANLISRNSLDFCVRGYSHGVYNRGQDSAGLLMFEQCNDNVVVLNSMCHGGDGVFGFAGKEALGDVPAPEGFDHARKGCNRNLFFGNDLSYAAAHGYEMTFSFRNTVFRNRMVDNAICGVWAGYSQDSIYTANIFRNNGEGAYGLERGGINIEHGKGNLIQFNQFIYNPVGVRLWWDEDPHLAEKPWVEANGFECGRTALYGNLHQMDTVAVEIDGCPDVTTAVNTYVQVDVEVQATGEDVPEEEPVALQPPPLPSFEAVGEREAVGLRMHLQGRENIVMTEWGPYDWESPLLARGIDRNGAHVWRVLGTSGAPTDVSLETAGSVDAEALLVESEGGPEVHVRPSGSGLLAYTLRVETPDGTLEGTRRTLRARWSVRAFESPLDPREDLAAWRAGAEGGVAFEVDRVDFPLGGRALAALPALAEVEGLDALPADRIGLIAEATVSLPAGRYTLRTRSDDGIRVRVDDEVRIEDWTHHASTTHEATLELAEAGERRLVVEWFELDGGAELVVELVEAD